MTIDPLKITPDPLRKVYLEAGIWSAGTCLDSLFVRNVRKAPEKIILSDSPDKLELTDIAPVSLKGFEAETIVNNLCVRFHELGLEQGQVVGIFMPNTIELPLALLACLRLGLIPALMPLLWTEREIQAALDLLQPKAMIGMSRVGTLFPADTLRYAAASLFSVRYVMAFGKDMPDGVINLQNVFETATHIKKESKGFAGKADTAAFVTFRITAHGPLPVVRSHNHAMSAALAPLLESHMEPDDEIILSTLQPASLAGLTSGFLSWLLSGGRLITHQMSNAGPLLEQIVSEKVTRLVLPAIAVPEITSAIENLPHAIKSILSVNANASARLPSFKSAPPYALIDCYALDELAFLAQARKDEKPRPLRPGMQVSPSTGIGPALTELGLSSALRLIVRGPSVPFSESHKEGFQQTGYCAQLEAEDLKITGRSDQLAFIGGMAVSLNEIAGLILQIDGVDAAQVNAVSDKIFGEILEARVHFSRTKEPQAQRLERVKKEFESLKLAPYKIPARFIHDPHIINQQETLYQAEKKQAV
jgi:non-ribosomal peptide synthetase component E (peptide arylation enzyme)